jgi:hypothetical protein
MTPRDDAPASRAALFRDLAGHGFVPQESWPLAVNDRIGTALPVTPAAETAASRAVEAEADAFAEEFWELPPGVRRRRWADLSARATAGPTAAFLAHLERGLDVAVVPRPDPAAESVAGIARELFVLRPRPKAVRRMAWSAENANHKATARALATPAAVGYHQGLYAELARLRVAPRPVAAAKPVSPAVAAGGRAARELAKAAGGATVVLVPLAIAVIVVFRMGPTESQRSRPPAPATNVAAGEAVNASRPGAPGPAVTP